MSLGRELADLQDAIEAARILAYELGTNHLPDDASERRAPLAIAAVLVLVDLRLRDLGRVFRGELDPWHLLAPHNEIPASADLDGDSDLFFHPWTVEERAHHTEAELARIERERQRRNKKK